ncbi:MAG: mechanosensitive ion channel [Calditrichia bacterium]
MTTFAQTLFDLLPTLATALIVFMFLAGLNYLLLGRSPEMGNDRKLPRQLIMFGLTMAGVIAIVLTLPIVESSKNQIISLLGVLLSGTIALSSTTIVSNAMAGIMLRITRPFRIGDFIRTADLFGRVSERGLLDTEIQTEYRELVSVPNTQLITNPVTVIRSSGTIISASLSLGYDIHHSTIEQLLIKAATEVGLQDAFVQIIDLGDFSVTYRVNGLLLEPKNMITTKSNLFRSILDTLHGNDIEIVSPNFMNQRLLDKERKILAAPQRKSAKKKKETQAEEIVFDKAEQAEQLEGAVETLKNDIESLKEKAKDTSLDEKSRLKDKIENKKEDLKSIQKTSVDDK